MPMLNKKVENDSRLLKHLADKAPVWCSCFFYQLYRGASSRNSEVVGVFKEKKSIRYPDSKAVIWRQLHRSRIETIVAFFRFLRYLIVALNDESIVNDQALQLPSVIPKLSKCLYRLAKQCPDYERNCYCHLMVDYYFNQSGHLRDRTLERKLLASEAATRKKNTKKPRKTRKEASTEQPEEKNEDSEKADQPEEKAADSGENENETTQ